MKKRTRSILSELSNIGTRQDNDYLIEASANNIIESSINLLNRIHREYDDDTANELERRVTQLQVSPADFVWTGSLTDAMNLESDKTFGV